MTDILEARLAKVEAELAIRNLVAAYAVAIDTRDMAKLASLYSPEAKAESGQSLPASEAKRIGDALQASYRTFHAVCGQVVELTSPSAAVGSVYCLARSEERDRWT